MSSTAASLRASLPAPKYTGGDEEEPSRAQQRGPRIVGAGQLDETQVVLKRAGPPAYGQRSGWRPRSQEDFGDGGAFPEVPVAQYPLDMGRKGATTSNALAVQVDGEGRVRYDAIARRGHGDGRIVHTSFKDLIPLRQRADAGELDLSRPTREVVAETADKTKKALEALISGAVAAQKPKNVRAAGRNEATFVRYTPASGQMGDNSKKQDRIIKIVERQRDPMEPPKFKHKKIPRGPPSPPPPVMHSPPRKLTAEDQEMWRIPPPISNWKNPKGYTVPLDKRLAADGRGLQDIAISDKHAQFAEAVKMAERHAREEVQQRAMMQQRLADKEKAQKEDKLRALAQQAREERGGGSGRRRRGSMDSRDSRDSRDRSSDSDSASDRDDAEVRERERARRERRKDEERKLRQTRMGAERRVQVMAREQNRDISEKVALGLAKPTQSRETMYDSRLFNQSSGFDSGFNEDNHYDKPLFAAQDAISSIYRPRAHADDDDGEAADAEMAKIQRTSRFGEALGKGTFRGASEAEVIFPLVPPCRTRERRTQSADAGSANQAREGPVQFEKDKADPFNVDKFLSEVDRSSAAKRGFGLQDEARQTKRPRVDDDDDGDD